MQTVQFNRPDGKKLNIEIIHYRPKDSSRNKTPDRHRHDFHSIFLILEGKSVQEIDFQHYELTKNQIMLIPKGAIHWEKEIKGLLGYTILFKDDFFSNHQKELLYGLLQYAVALRKLLITISEKDVTVIKLYFELLMKEQQSDDHQNQTFILQNLMLAFLNKLEGLIQDLPEINSFISFRRPFQRFIQSVEATYFLQKKLDFYALELNITKRKLNEITKQVTGQTATNYII
ncbi:MAG: AraC family ligand binding domain-containing protein, partial [Bacteroidota bacterium]